jgi:hypothetical protein
MVSYYGSYLQCDFVQASHHALATDSTDPVESARRHNATKDIYKAINPTHALVPTSRTAWARRKVMSVNKFLEAKVNTNKGNIYLSEDSGLNKQIFTFN